MADALPVEDADVDRLPDEKPKGGKPKGYLPLKSNATVKPLPAHLQALADSAPTATDIPVYAPYKDPALVPVEEGSAAAETIKKERSKSRAKEPVFRAKAASDVVVRADRIGSTLKNVERAGKLGEKTLASLSEKIATKALDANEKKVVNRAKQAVQTASEFADYSKEDVEEGIAKRKKYPLVSYQDKQKANEEDVRQYAKNIEVYVPSTRKSFLKFIETQYAKEFTLTREIKEPDPKACEALLKGGPASADPFRYQRFIKEYIRQSSPYRGILVYHGLGSGKTCSSIAAAEALYGIANKKIIVMTPQSLRDNFIKEISFCGFKHFSLYNHWTKLPLLTREYNEKRGIINNEPRTLYEIYGRSVLSLGPEYIRRIKDAAIRDTSVDDDGNVLTNAYLWVPDFSKPQNFDLPADDEEALSPVERDQIKAQLNETINNRFHFISYNGISNAELKAMCCQGGTLDNAVIVIDEIHNLSRLMRGSIEPFLIPRPGRKRKITAQPVEPGPWIPNLCDIENKTYSRGYMFYRLFIGAKNSKIIGLSGTPLINFPEELGVLTNILAGYIDCTTIHANTLDIAQQETFARLIDEDPRVDFVRFELGAGKLSATLSVFQEGYIKVLKEKGAEEEPELVVEEESKEEKEEKEGPKRMRLQSRFLGVRQSNAPEAQLGIQAVAERVIATCSAAGIPMNPLPDKPVSHPRLPPDQDSFRARFVDTVHERVRPENKLVLQKRLAGLVSYYKGAKPDFLPRIGKDEIVECYFSGWALKKYVEARSYEISKDVGKPEGDAKGDLYAAVEVFAKTKNPSSYRFRSRSCCNFAFPFDRPYPKSEKDLTEETAKAAEVEDLDADNLEEDLTEEQEAEREEAKKKVKKEERRVAKELSDEEEEEEEEEEETASKSAKNPKNIYKEQLAAALKQLNDGRDTWLPMADTEKGLKNYSCKLYEMLMRMEENPGPSLVYSAFEHMEGIGVLTASLLANGYEEIKFTGNWFGPEPILTDEAIASLAKGPGINRFMAFSGKVKRRERRILLGMLNSQWSDVPRGIQKILRRGGFDMKKKYLHGEVIKCIGITGAGAEGISLRNVRQVHIMEPFWNLVRLEQVKGRAIRICSHMDLPVEEREVDIFTYVSAFSPEQIRKRDEEGGVPLGIQTADGDDGTGEKRILTSDQRVLDVALRKEKIAKELLDIMKESSIDCALNAADNEAMECLVVEEKTNPYMFDPDLVKDETSTGIEAALSKAKAAAVAKSAVPKVGEERTSMIAGEERKAPVQVRLARRIRIEQGGKSRQLLLGEPHPRTGIIQLYDGMDRLRANPIGEGRRSGTALGITILKLN